MFDSLVTQDVGLYRRYENVDERKVGLQFIGDTHESPQLFDTVQEPHALRRGQDE